MMKRKYFFESYNWKGNNGLSNLQYCPVCGTKCLIIENKLRARPTCPSCGFIHYKNPNPGVVVLIERDGKVLLGKRGTDSFQPEKWCLPGGFIEFGEDFIAASVREVKEESNLDIEIKSILNVSSNFLSHKLHTLVIVLNAVVINGNLKPGDDIIELDWFRITGKLPEIAFEADRYLIEHLNEIKKDCISIT